MSTTRQTAPSSLRQNVYSGELEIAVPAFLAKNYTTEEWLLFRRILENALAALPVATRTSEKRAQLTRNILECAATGERDPVELRIAALAEPRKIAA